VAGPFSRDQYGPGTTLGFGVTGQCLPSQSKNDRAGQRLTVQHPPMPPLFLPHAPVVQAPNGHAHYPTL
jgi:hypothetical protein